VISGAFNNKSVHFVGVIIVWLYSSVSFSDYCSKLSFSRSQWPRGLRRRSAAARLLGLWFQIPPGAWMFVCCECSVLSSRGLCDELITRPEESCRLWYVVVCDLETSWMKRPCPTGGCCARCKLSFSPIVGRVIAVNNTTPQNCHAVAVRSHLRASFTVHWTWQCWRGKCGCFCLLSSGLRPPARTVTRCERSIRTLLFFAHKIIFGW
jgi:hypothetical protein